MNWRDLFYFSKGERRALTVLLILISLSWLALQFKENKQEADLPKATASFNNTAGPSEATRTNNPQSKNPSSGSQSPKHSFRKKSRFLRGENRISSERKSFYTRKFPEGTIVELNSADTTILKKVPGIGSTFARRIIKYRNLLGGFYSVTQLSEVYGIDEERYEAMKSWFTVDVSLICQLHVNIMSSKKLSKHPYISYRQARCIEQLVKQKGRLSGWENLQLLEEFTKADKEHLIPYLSFD